MVPVGATVLVAPPGATATTYLAFEITNCACNDMTSARKSRTKTAPGVSIPGPVPAGAVKQFVKPVEVSSVSCGEGGPRSATVVGGAAKPSVAPRPAKSSVPSGMSKLRAYTARPGAGASLVELFLYRS